MTSGIRATKLGESEPREFGKISLAEDMASEDAVVVNVAENVEQQQLEVPPKITTTMLPLLERHITKLEEAMGDVTDAIEKRDESGQNISKKLYEKVRAFEDTTRRNVDLEAVVRTKMQRGNVLEALITGMQEEINNLQGEASLAGAATTGPMAAQRIDVPKPRVFRGNRYAKEVDNFL